MKNSALRILNKLEKEGELSLGEISSHIRPKYNDHRDWYVFASLVAIGYVDNDHLLDTENPDPNRLKEQLLAREYFASNTTKSSANYEHMSWTRSGDNEGGLQAQKFSLTGKGSLYLSELRARQSDRRFALLSGILVGIIVAIVGTHVG